MSTEVFQVVAPVVIIVLIGYVIERMGAGFDSHSLSRFVLWLGTPSLIFSSLIKTELPEGALWQLPALACLVVLAGAGLGAAVLFVRRLPIRSYLPSMMMPNAGNVGLPVLYFAFPGEGLAIGAAMFLGIAITQYTIGPIILAGDFGFRKLAKMPFIWAVLAIAFFKFTALAPPRILLDTTGLLGGAMIPVMLILLGGALARLQVTDLRLSLFLGASRLVVGVASGLAVVLAFGISGVLAGCLFLMACMPSALVTYIFADYYKRDPEKVAGMVVCSTAVTFAVLPVLVAIALVVAEM